MNKIYLKIAFDDKDLVKAKFAIKWDGQLKLWYSEDAETAPAAQAMADELAGVRDFAMREQAAAERKAEAAFADTERQRVADVLATLEVRPTLAELQMAKMIVGKLGRSKFLLADDEKAFRRGIGKLATALGLEYSTRNSNFDRAKITALLGNAIALSV